jgi:hypothetical protein
MRVCIFTCILQLLSRYLRPNIPYSNNLPICNTFRIYKGIYMNMLYIHDSVVIGIFFLKYNFVTNIITWCTYKVFKLFMTILRLCMNSISMTRIWEDWRIKQYLSSINIIQVFCLYYITQMYIVHVLRYSTFWVFHAHNTTLCRLHSQSVQTLSIVGGPLGVGNKIIECDTVFRVSYDSLSHTCQHPGRVIRKIRPQI